MCVCVCMVDSMYSPARVFADTREIARAKISSRLHYAEIQVSARSAVKAREGTGQKATTGFLQYAEFNLAHAPPP